MTMSSGYSVSRSSGVCAATGRAFAPGEAYVACLMARAEGGEAPEGGAGAGSGGMGGGVGGLERRDYSLEAWGGGGRPTAGVFASWRGVYRPSDKPKKSALSDEELTDIFEQLTAEGAGLHEKQRVFRYVLSLLLIRRRVLRLIGTRKVDGVSSLLVVPKGGDASQPIVVEDPGLSDETIADAVEQLGAIMSGDDGGGGVGS